ncbi:hypothetical protein [Vibrio atlanticus]|uniref:hypothetical protein n=1 Tax=Vibrio atlanticus TaxID=693153 RepID=UPI000EFC0DA2|nr:hypothetical protein [Vibrio atlanticus]
MEIPNTLFVAVGAVIAALITSGVSLVNLVISKESKVSEFRREWVVSLQNDISELLGKVTKLKSKWNWHLNHSPEAGKCYVESCFDDLDELEALSSKIQIKLDPEYHKELVEAVLEIERVVSTPSLLNDGGGVTGSQKKLVKYARKTAHDEWLKIKEGEVAYNRTVKVMKVGLFSSFFLVLFALWLLT